MTTITTSSGGFIGPRSLKSHGNPTSCSRLRTDGIQSKEVQRAPTATPDATAFHQAFSSANQPPDSQLSLRV